VSLDGLLPPTTLRGTVPAPILWQGILLGLGAAAPIGPVNVEIARRAIRGGWAQGVLLGLGAVTIDVGYAIAVSLGVRLIIANAIVRTTLGIAAAAVLAYLGMACLRSAREQYRADPMSQPDEKPVTNSYPTGLAMTAVNPMTLAFWFGVVPGLVGALSKNPRHDLPVVSAGVFLGATAWVLFFATTMSLLRRVGKRRTMIGADFAGGVMLLAFAASMIRSMIWR
jgi:L-lysine exporter family protein LysE/ArgO